jgi:DNA mismatch repair ATPase MutL
VGLALRQGVPLIEAGQTQTSASVKRALYDFYRQERPDSAPQVHEPGALQSYLGQARRQGAAEAGRAAQVERPAAIFVGTYMLMSGAEALILMDCKRLAQAHFRVHMTQALSEPGLLEKQKLILPQVIDLSAAAWTRCSAHLDLFAQVGLEIRELGTSRIALNAIPQHLGEEKSSLISEWFKDTLENAETPLSEDMLPLWIEALLPFVEVPEDMNAFERLFTALERLPVLAQQEILAKAQRYVEPGEVAKLFALGTTQAKGV